MAVQVSFDEKAVTSGTWLFRESFQQCCNEALQRQKQWNKPSNFLFSWYLMKYQGQHDWPFLTEQLWVLWIIQVQRGLHERSGCFDIIWEIDARAINLKNKNGLTIFIPHSWYSCLYWRYKCLIFGYLPMIFPWNYISAYSSTFSHHILFPAT